LQSKAGTACWSIRTSLVRVNNALASITAHEQNFVNWHASFVWAYVVVKRRQKEVKGYEVGEVQGCRKAENRVGDVMVCTGT
jgi:hypothetical protein